MPPEADRSAVRGQSLTPSSIRRHGPTTIEHVHRRTRTNDAADETYVATPDEVVGVEPFGGEAIVTGSHLRPTDRVAEAADTHVPI